MSRAAQQSPAQRSAAQAIIAALQGKMAEWRADPSKAQTTGWELPLLSGTVEDIAARNYQGEGDPEAARKVAKALAKRKGAKDVAR